MKVAGVYKIHEDIETIEEVIRGLDEPLGLECILAVAQGQGHEVDLFIPKDTKDMEEIIAFNPNIILYSSTTNRIDFYLKFNKELKKIKSNLISIVGGYHPSAEPSIIKEGFDFAILGEGEETFRELLTSIEKNKDYEKIKGIAFLGEGIVVNPRRQRIENLDKLPDPFRTEKIFKQKSTYLSYPPTKKRKTAFLEYSRGCTFNCSFCASPNVLGRKIIYRKPETITRQLKNLKENFGINYIFFTDLNMTLNPKKVEELCDSLIQENLNIYWTILSGFRNISYGLLKKMKQAGCVKISWGLENILQPPWIKKETKKLCPSNKIQEILNYSSEIGILSETFLIIGWPKETREQIKETMNRLPYYNIHIASFPIYTPFPGTLDHKIIREKGFLIEKDKSKYDVNHLVFNHPCFSGNELKEIQGEMSRTFYFSEEYKKRISKFIKKHPRYKKIFDEFLSLVYKKLK
ncbi:MAG: cobalamin B12-binding domain-containing protein [Candidatus Pacearchaeota archaeon]|nr:MAG: cobalamin B12-binding domain-containing protein [Candidatus Pacearchaeota archaeon]